MTICVTELPDGIKYLKSGTLLLMAASLPLKMQMRIIKLFLTGPSSL